MQAFRICRSDWRGKVITVANQLTTTVTASTGTCRVTAIPTTIAAIVITATAITTTTTTVTTVIFIIVTIIITIMSTIFNIAHATVRCRLVGSVVCNTASSRNVFVIVVATIAISTTTSRTHIVLNKSLLC